MSELLKTIKQAEKEKRAVAHFNISNFEMLKAVSNIAAKFGLPVIIGVSEGERDYFGVHHTVDLVRSYNLFLNADHTYSLDKVREAAEVGYDAIVFDAAKLPFEENIRETKKAVQVAKEIRPEIVVEGELGYIGQSSKILEELPKGAVISSEDLPTAEQASQFIKETGVDMLAPAVGNIHGVFKNAPNPELNVERIREIKQAVGVPLVLHGGSGIRDEEFVAAINAGISIIHISTELRVVWRKALEQAFKDNPGEIAPYKIIPRVVEAMEQVIENRVRLFSKL